MTAADTAATLASGANLPSFEASLHFEGGYRRAARGGFPAGRALGRAREPVAPPDARRHRRRAHHRAGARRLVQPDAGLGVVLVDPRRAARRRLLPRRRRPPLPPDDPAAEPVRAREPAAPRGGRRRTEARLVLALLGEGRNRRRRGRAALLVPWNIGVPIADPAAPRDLPLLHAHELRHPLRSPTR